MKTFFFHFHSVQVKIIRISSLWFNIYLILSIYSFICLFFFYGCLSKDGTVEVKGFCVCMCVCVCNSFLFLGYLFDVRKRIKAIFSTLTN